MTTTYDGNADAQAPEPIELGSANAFAGDGLSDAIIKVVGVGGGGGNAVKHMLEKQVRGVEFICANTDAQALKACLPARLLPLGANGLGAGAKPEVGTNAALEAEQGIRESLKGCQMVFITAGMGGGTGTGAAPVIARVAKEMGILTVGVVTKPFEFEGSRRMRAADEGVRQLEQHVDSLIVILNDRLLEEFGDDISQHQAFSEANNVLLSAVSGITNVIHVSGLVNVDFEDVKTVMEQPGRAMMGTGQAKGADRATKAADEAISCPLLEGIDLCGANGVLVLIAASQESFKLSETRNVMNAVRRYAHEDAHIIMGASYDENLGETMRVTVIATGLSAAQQRAALPQHQGNVVNHQGQSYGMGAPRGAGAGGGGGFGGMRGEIDSSNVRPFEASRRMPPANLHDLPIMTEEVVMEAPVYVGNGVPVQSHPVLQGSARSAAHPSSRVVAAPARRAQDMASPHGRAQKPAATTDTPAVWRVNRTHAGAKVDALHAAGMEEVEIPAFLRKQAD